jgi:hypothetical protein
MSNRSDSLIRLPRAAEELLARWPDLEKEEGEWEQTAESVMVRVAMVRPGSTDAALLAPPLPSSSPNGSSPISLAELARSVAAESAANDAKQLAHETLSVATRARASTPSVAELLQAELAPASKPGPTSAAAPISAPRRSTGKRSFAGPILAAGLAVLGMAAAAVIVVRAQQEAPAVAAATAIAEPDQPAAPAATLEPGAEPIPKTLSPDELGNAVEDDPAPAAPKAAQLAAGSAPPAAKGVATTEAAPTAIPAPTAPPAKDEKEAAKMKPAAQPSDVPQQPSTGAAQAAVAQVIGSARACVAGHDAPSRATLVFGSDGRVQSVSISGPAAGTPAEACIRAALSRARVEPFAKPTFSVGATVRP